MKQHLKEIYLTLRKIFLDFLSVLFFREKIADSDGHEDIRKILFVRIDRIGDLVLSTPAIKALKQQYPQAGLFVMASRSNFSILKQNPYIDQVVVFDRRQTLIQKIKCVMLLRENHFDLAVDPYADYEMFTALITFLSGAHKRIGYAAFGRELFFNVQPPVIKKEQHFIDQTLGILEPLGIMAADKAPQIFLSADERNWSIKLLQEKVLTGKPLVGLHPGAFYESQRWPYQQFADLITLLQKDGRFHLILFGGPAEKNLIEKIVSMAPQKLFTYITDNLRRFAALLAACQLLVCNNSGPLHMAVALNVPTISTMGPTNKDRWMPMGPDHQVFRIDDLPCIGCNLGYCKIKTHDCMRLITPIMIRRAIYQCLNIS